MKIFLPIIILLIILGVGGGAYYIGRQDAAPTPTSTSVITTPSPTPSPKKKVTAGGAVSFATYTILLPDNWTATQEHDSKTDIDRLTLKRDGYEIRIFQGATGGAQCLYPGDQEAEGPSGKYDTFVTIMTQDGVTLRRSGTAGSTGFTLCQKQPDGIYIQPTSFGHISYLLPTNFDSSVLSEMDTIIASLKK